MLIEVPFTLKPGEVSAQTIEVDGWWDRWRFAWHFLKVAFCFIKPWKPNPIRVTSTIIQGGSIPCSKGRVSIR